MALKVEPITREFRYSGRRLADPGPALTPDQVRDVYAAQYPELANAAIEGPELTAGKQVYSFTCSIGAKG